VSWRRFFRRQQRDREAARDIEFYLETEIADNRARGMPLEEARLAARRKLGNPGLIREEIYRMNSFAFLDSIRKDTLLAVRSMRKNTAFAATAVLALALGLGANAAIFSLFYNALLRPLPYRNSSQLLSIGREGGNMRGIPGGLAGSQEFVAWRAESHLFEGITAWNTEEFNLTGPEMPERVLGANVTADFLPVLGVQPALGRGFSAEDDRPGSAAVVLLTQEIWQRRFRGDPAIVGRTLVMNGAPYRIAGVLPARFRFPGDVATEVLVPSRLPAQPVWAGPRIVLMHVVARPRAGVSAERVVAELSAISARYQSQMPRFYFSSARPSKIMAASLQERLVGGSRTTLVALLWAVGILLLMTCVNVANLQLARATVRHREIGLRAALGASRARLAQWMVVESLVLSSVAGMVGLGVAYGLLAILRTSQGVPLRDSRDFEPGWMLWAVTLGLSLAAGTLAGLLPALSAPRIELNEVLKSGALALMGGRGARARSALVLVQVALALVLLMGSGLLLRSLQRVLAVNWGFRPDHLLTLQMRLPQSRYDNPTKQGAFVEALLQRVSRLPAVETAAASNSLPLLGYPGTGSVRFEGQPAVPPGQQPSVPILIVSPAYFAALGTPLLAGREFSTVDAPNAELACIVNATFAGRFYPGGDAVGRRIQWGNQQQYVTIVGVTADIRQTGRESGADAQLFLPVTQNPVWNVNLIVRTRTDPLSLASTVRSVVWAVDKDEPVYEVASMDDLIRKSGANRRLETLLLTSFGLLAMVLAALGIYGVVAETVNQRIREIGLRMALGAQARDVVGMVLRRSLALTLAGIAVGMAAGFSLVRYLQSLLFGVDARDAVAFGGAGVLLLAVALAAGYLPARRAARIDPVETLRCE
jgi:predicted permease